MILRNEWISGFVDGEGCFSFSVFKNEGMKMKYQIQGDFSVVQHKRDIQVLHDLKTHFGCGNVSVNHGDRYQYRVKNLKHLIQIIIPFFETHPLHTVKKLQLPVFKELCLNLEAKKHFSPEGFEEMKLLVKKLSDLKRMD
jgi:hypothetical protein